MDAALEKIEKFPVAYKVLITLGLIAALYYMYTTNVEEPALLELQQIQGNIDKADSELKDISFKIQHLTEVEQEIRKLRSQLTEAISLLPVKSEIPSLLRHVATLAEKSGLTIKTFRPQPEVNRRYYFEVPVAMQITGNFHEVANFFDQVSKMRRVVNVTGVRMVRSDCGNDGFSGCESTNGRLEIECRAVTYRFAASELQK